MFTMKWLWVAMVLIVVVGFYVMAFYYLCGEGDVVLVFNCMRWSVFSLRDAMLARNMPWPCLCIFTFIRQKAGSNNWKAKRQTHEKKIKRKNIGTWCKEYTKCYKLARYLQRNVRDSCLAHDESCLVCIYFIYLFKISSKGPTGY